MSEELQRLTSNVSVALSEELQRPASNDNREAWKAYWAAQDMPWRTEPEIDGERQRYLATRRAVKPDIENAIYPFRDETGGIRLTRGDVEWLLATHRNGTSVGPMSVSVMSDVSWRETRAANAGIDLRGANLVGVDLSWLPLTLMLGGLGGPGTLRTTAEQREAAAIHLEGAKLTGAHLEGAALRNAHLEGAILRQARLERARLEETHLEGTTLEFAHLEGTQLFRTYLQARMLTESELQALRQWKPDFPQTLLPADIGDSYFDGATRLNYPIFAPNKGCEQYGSTLFADVHWSDANLGIVDWASVRKIGNEYIAQSGMAHSGKKVTDTAIRLRYYQRSVRANRQLASALRSQGLGEYGDYFAYRAQLCQRHVFRREHQYLRYLGSVLLWLIAGYGYRPLRSFVTYLLVILSFAGIYFLFRSSVQPSLNLLDSVIFSIASFHGRGFVPGENVTLHNPITIAAALEAVIGLVIEITFIATFTQRFFAR